MGLYRSCGGELSSAEQAIMRQSSVATLLINHLSDGMDSDWTDRDGQAACEMLRQVVADHCS